MILKNIIAKLLFYSGMPRIARNLLQKGKVTIIVLHDPEPSNAERLFKAFKKRYNIIDLNQYLAACNGGEVSIPERAMIITLDDGHAGNYKLCEVLERLQLPVTIFLCSGIVGTHRNFWFRYPGLGYPSAYYKKMSNDQRLAALASVGFGEQEEYKTRQALSHSEISGMRTLVNFQSHTVFHPCLTQCSDLVSRKEIFDSRAQLETELGLRINAIAFPNGDYGEREIGFAREAGYHCALTCDTGLNDLGTDLFRLKRFGVDDKDSPELALLKACGIWDWIKGIPAFRLFWRS